MKPALVTALVTASCIAASLVATLPVDATLAATGAKSASVWAFAELSPERVAEVAAMLPAEPMGMGRPISDRAFWTSPEVIARTADVAAKAAGLLEKPLPAWNDDDYLDFTRTGQRPRGEGMMNARAQRLMPLVLAECLEDKGRYLPRIREALAGYVEQPTWTIPAHDGSLGSFHRKSYYVDLGASLFAADLGEALWLLGDRLDAGTRGAVSGAVEERVFAPIRATLRTGKGHAWIGSEAHPVQNNWNAVCLSGTVAAALAMLPDRADRGAFAAAGEHYVHYFLNSLRDSGYCDEGGGYWSYGFGNFAALRETLVRQTGGRIDLFSLPKVREAALFGARYQMTDGLLPTFADSRWGMREDAGLVDYCTTALNLGGTADRAHIASPHLYSVLMTPTLLAGAEPRPGAAPSAGGNSATDIGVRTYFEDVGVLVSRPSPGGASRLGLAVKAGGNSSHSHNDVGSFAITVGSEMPVADPGGPLAYDSKTFTAERFKRKLLNSYGHPVPVIGGRLQRDATRVHAKVVHTSFTDEADEISIDMTAAYDCPTLKSLVRTVRYDRGGKGGVTIRDAFAFSEPTTVQEALTCRGQVDATVGSAMVFAAGKEAVAAAVRPPAGSTLGAPKVEQISELGVTFTRVGVDIEGLGEGGTVEITLSPR